MPDDPRGSAPIPAPGAPPADAPEHRDPNESAPFLTWTALYLIVAIALALDMAALAAVGWIYR